MVAHAVDVVEVLETEEGETVVVGKDDEDTTAVELETPLVEESVEGPFVARKPAIKLGPAGTALPLTSLSQHVPVPVPPFPPT